MWVTKLLNSPIKKGFFAQKRPNLARNWHFCSFWARPCRLIWCPVGGLAGGCGAGCISQDTYLLYGISKENNTKRQKREAKVDVRLLKERSIVLRQ